MSLKKEYESKVLSLHSVKMQINLRAAEGNNQEVLRLLKIKEEIVCECDDLYCRLYMKKAG